MPDQRRVHRTMGNLQLDGVQTLPNQITKAPERPSGERGLYKALTRLTNDV